MVASAKQNPEVKLSLTVAQRQDLERVKAFYDVMTAYLPGAEYSPGWVKGLYPTEEFLENSVAQQELLFAVRAAANRQDCTTLAAEALTCDCTGSAAAGEILAAFILNHETAAGYEQIAWQLEAEPAQIGVIHALAISPQLQGRGLGKELVAAAIAYAQQKQLKALRLDVLDGNLPAQKLYERMGFAFRGTLALYYEDTGLTDYLLYELVL